MSDENIKSDIEDNADKKEKPEATKKQAAASKKIKEKNNDNTGKGVPKKKIIEKLQAMGVMSGGKANAAASNNDPEKGRLPKILIASVIVALVAGTFVWGLNKETANEHVMPSAHSGAWQPSADNSRNNNPGYRAFDNGMQQQQQAQEQQRVQQQKWAQQWQQSQEQQRAQQQKWAQQPPTQEQYRTQQQKWAQQQQQVWEQQRIQQQNWAEQQQRQAQEQQRAQQQKWTHQQPNYGYSPYFGYNTPRYQQPGPYYYGPQY